MPRKERTILAVVGGQYGSEGKGVVVGHLADRFDVHVRVGGPNAGHSVAVDGTVYKMQIIPVGWINPNATLILGRGMLVNLDQLAKEVELVRKVDSSITDRLFIDKRAGVLSATHHEAEGGTEGELHQRIGSTGEGVGEARLARVSRDTERFRFVYQEAEKCGGKDWSLADMLDSDTPYTLRNAWDEGRPILLEGTQGMGLSLIHGPWPYCTSADTSAAQLAADAGISARAINRIVLVIRTYPIRVAGNSGPMKNELTWQEISNRVGKEVIERTTVTKKVRRIGEWDHDLVDQAVVINAPTSLALMFADYLSPDDEGVTEYGDLSPRTLDFIAYLEKGFATPVSMVGTGWNKEHGTWVVVERENVKL